MAILNDYNQLIRENFDISDDATRKCIIALEDAEQTQLLAALSSALYDKIVEKVGDIDFGSIPNSRGDITKVEGFENTVECLNIIRKLVLEYRENPDVVDTVLTAIENVRSRKALFMKAYALNIEFPMVLYNLIVMAIEQSVSFLIAVCIQYIKDPASQNLNSALDKVAYNNTRDNLLYMQLVDFNKSCLSRELDDTINQVIKTGKLTEDCEWQERPELGGNKVLVINVGKNDIDAEIPDRKCDSPFVKMPGKEESPICPDCKNRPCTCGDCEKHEPESKRIAIHGSTDAEPVNEDLGTIALIGALTAGAVKLVPLGLKGLRLLIKNIIPTIRNITYYLINYRVKLSDALAVQAQFIEANANKLQYSMNSDLTDEKRKKVVERQKKIAEKLRTWSNRIAIDNKKAQKDAQKMVDDEAKKKKINDLKDKLPPDIMDKGSIFVR